MRILQRSADMGCRHAVSCPGCGAVVGVPDEVIGHQEVSCPHCKEKFIVDPTVGPMSCSRVGDFFPGRRFQELEDNHQVPEVHLIIG